MVSTNCLVLEAPPGAGKTSTVPLALLLTDPSYLASNKTILVLEPRRVAAKAAARRMSALLGERVGQTVGYRVRLDTKVSSKTRIEVVTDGILLRRLQHDPELQGVGAVIFDEFHERGLDSDLSLALCLDAQRMVAPELRLLVMSATLGGGLAEQLVQLMSSNQTPVRPVPLVRSEGRSFPVKTEYLGYARGMQRGSEHEHVAGAVLKALRDTSGDVLCFLPGVAEINRVRELLVKAGRPVAGVDILPLHGNLSPEQQDAAISGGPAGRRRVVLSTNIAESSVTISGVRAVVDSGLCRRMHYDPARGQDRLQLEMVSQSSADQRQGRAGRLGPGRCYRLWEDGGGLEATTAPEIELTDLTPMVLQLAMWGDPEGASLPWLDPPNPQRVAIARQLLVDLGAVTPQGKVTEEGRRMAAMGVHPRLAHMVLRGVALDAAELAAVLAALLSERDLLRSTGMGCDLRLRLQALQSGGSVDDAAGSRILQSAHLILRQLSWRPLEQPAVSSRHDMEDEETVLDSIEEAEELGGNGREGGAEAASSSSTSTSSSTSSSTSTSTSTSTGAGAGMAAAGKEPAADGGSRAREVGQAADGVQRRSGRLQGQPRSAEGGAWQQQATRPGLVGVLLALAYPDRIAKRQERANKRSSFMLRDGSIARLADVSDELEDCDWLAVAELGSTDAQRASGRNDSIYLAAPLTPQAMTSHLRHLLEERTNVFWAPASKAVFGRRQCWLGALMLSEVPVQCSDEQALPVLLKAIREMGVHSFLPAAALQWCDRVVWLRDNGLEELPDMSEDGLAAGLDHWLAPALSGVRTKADLLRLPWDALMRSRLSWADQQRVEAEAPAMLELPTGSRVRINYSRDNATVSVRIQEVFGLLETPRLAGGRIALVMELLAPGQQPLQVTSDLRHFWANSYIAVKKDMKNRYPRHYWPDDPAQAEPTRLTKKGMERAAAQQEAAAPVQQAGKGAGGKQNKTKAPKRN